MLKYVWNNENTEMANINSFKNNKIMPAKIVMENW